MTRSLALCLLALCACMVAGTAPPPSPPPYNTPPGEAPVVLSSEALGSSSDALGQGIVNFNFASLGVQNGKIYDAEFRTCNVCYTQFANKQVSSPTYIPATSWCSAYRNSACCNADTVAQIDAGTYNGALYPGYSAPCGAVSPKCAAYFQREACFYECDRNMGRFRQFRDNGCIDSSGSENAWSVINIPVSATMCNQMYADCASDLFCNTTHRSYFDLPNLVPAHTCTACVPVSKLYASGADLCAAVFSDTANTTAGSVPAFVSTTGPINSYYVWPNKGDAPFSTANPNPNDNVNTALGVNTALNGAASTLWPVTPTMPPLCPWRPKFNAATQCISDMYYFFGMMDAVSLYTANGTYAPAASPTSGAATAATTVAVAAAAAAALLF